MKRVVTISIILLILVGCSVLGLLYIADTNQNMAHYLDQSEEFLQEENWEAAEKQISAAQELWESAGSTINTYVNHNTVDSIGENLTRLSSQLRQHQKQPAETLMETIRFELDHLYEREFPSLRNIL